MLYNALPSQLTLYLDAVSDTPPFTHVMACRPNHTWDKLIISCHVTHRDQRLALSLWEGS